MALLVIVLAGGTAHVPIFPTRWLVSGTIILSRGLGHVDSSGRDRALRPRAMGPAITTIFIVLAFLMDLARSFLGLSLLETMGRHGLCLLGAEHKRALVLGMILGRFWGRTMASGAVSIHLTDPQKKVQGGLCLSRDSFLDGLVSVVLSMTFLLGLGTDGGSEAIAE